MMLSGLLTAWMGHTDASRADAQDMSAALLDVGLSQKAASITMGLSSEQQLSRQLAGTEPLNAYRLTCLPPAFHVALLRRRAARLGAVVLAPEEVALIRGAAVLGRKTMLKMIPLAPPAQKRSA